MKYISAFLLGLLVMLGVLYFVNKPMLSVGSVMTTSDYIATTTRNFDGTAMTNLTVLRNGPGAIGNVVITGAAAGTINLYNATTSDVTKRTNNVSTSSILIATIPNSAAAGTYSIDASFGNGLLVELLGTIPTSTILTR